MTERTTARLWEKAISIIDCKLLMDLKQRRKLLRWLERLLQEGDDGERLVICLAIDLAYDAYRIEKLNHVRTLFRSININAPKARNEFAFHLERLNRTGHLTCASSFFAAESESSQPYAVVMRVQKFISCIGSSLLFLDTVTDRNRLLRRISRNPKFRLSDPNSWWTHESGIVWLTHADEIWKMLNCVPSDVRATAAKNALGLAHPQLKADTPVDYVLVEYSSTFGQTCYQPTAFDAWWKDEGHYYLSWRKEDNWGRAHDCVGHTGRVTPVRMRERVHHCYQGPNGEFTVTYLGTYPGDAAFSAELKQRRLALKDEAYNRLRSAPPPSKAKTRPKRNTVK